MRSLATLAGHLPLSLLSSVRRMRERELRVYLSLLKRKYLIRTNYVAAE